MWFNIHPSCGETSLFCVINVIYHGERAWQEWVSLMISSQKGKDSPKLVVKIMFSAVPYCICREHNIRIFQHQWKQVYVVQQEVKYAEESGEESTGLLVSEVNYLSPSSQELFSFVNQFKVVLESCYQNILPCHRLVSMLVFFYCPGLVIVFGWGMICPYAFVLIFCV